MKNPWAQVCGYLGVYGYPTRMIKTAADLHAAVEQVFEISGTLPLNLLAARIALIPKAERRRLAKKNIKNGETPSGGAAFKPEYELPTVAEVAEHCLGREPLEEEIYGEIRGNDVVIRYTCIRPTVSKAITDQLTPPEGWL